MFTRFFTSQVWSWQVCFGGIHGHDFFFVPWVNPWPCKTALNCGRTGLDPCLVAFATKAASNTCFCGGT